MNRSMEYLSCILARSYLIWFGLDGLDESAVLTAPLRQKRSGVKARHGVGGTMLGLDQQKGIGVKS